MAYEARMAKGNRNDFLRGFYVGAIQTLPSILSNYPLPEVRTESEDLGRKIGFRASITLEIIGVASGLFAYSISKH